METTIVADGEEDELILDVWLWCKLCVLLDTTYGAKSKYLQAYVV